MAKTQGGGSIRRRGARYELRARIPDGRGGSVRRSFYGDTPAECRQLEADAVKAAKASGVARPARGTLGEWLTEWLETMAPLGDRAPSTVEGYGYALAHIIRDPIAKQRLAAVHGHRLVAVIARRGKSLSQRRQMHTVLRLALSDAVDAGRIAINPMDRMKRPKETSSDVSDVQMRAITKDELAVLLPALSSDQMRALVEFAWRTGLRRGELCGLRWADVDFDAAVVRVRQQVIEPKGGARITSRLKSKRSRRDVPMNQTVVALLRAHRKAELARELRSKSPWSDSGRGLVFRGQRGEMLTPSNVSGRVVDAAKAAGMEGKSLHGCRHGFASMALRENVPVTTVAAWIGDSVDVLLETYAWALPGQDHALMERLA